jgi:hypothetical protein
MMMLMIWFMVPETPRPSRADVDGSGAPAVQSDAELEAFDPHDCCGFPNLDEMKRRSNDVSGKILSHPSHLPVDEGETTTGHEALNLQPCGDRCELIAKP